MARIIQSVNQCKKQTSRIGHHHQVHRIVIGTQDKKIEPAIYFWMDDWSHMWTVFWTPGRFMAHSFNLLSKLRKIWNIFIIVCFSLHFQRPLKLILNLINFFFIKRVVTTTIKQIPSLSQNKHLIHLHKIWVVWFYNSLLYVLTGKIKTVLLHKATAQRLFWSSSVNVAEYGNNA